MGPTFVSLGAATVVYKRLATSIPSKTATVCSRLGLLPSRRREEVGHTQDTIVMEAKLLVLSFLLGSATAGKVSFRFLMFVNSLLNMTFLWLVFFLKGINLKLVLFQWDDSRM